MTLKTYRPGSLRQRVLEFIENHAYSSERDIVKSFGRSWFRDGKRVYYDMVINKVLHTLKNDGWIDYDPDFRNSETKSRAGCDR